MTLDQHPQAHPAVERRVPLESVLGSASGRYFGAGYRSVSYALSSVCTDHGVLAGVGQVTYPPTWSTDPSGKGRPAHLSSIDATLLPLALLEHSTTASASIHRVVTAQRSDLG